MPRVSRAEAEKNRAAIEQASSHLIRERGLGVSVADLMGAAGLTHGGFYGHFASKDALTAIACANAMAESTARWQQRIDQAATPLLARAALVQGYLTTQNRAKPAASCPLAALAGDVAREPHDKPIRAAYNAGFEQLLAQLTACQPAALAPAAQRADALVQMATMVGAMMLARATEGTAVSDELLEAARAHLLSSSD